MTHRLQNQVERPRDILDRVVSSLRTSPDWDKDERPRRTPFRRLAAMSEGVSTGYTAVVIGKDPLPLFAHIAAFLALPAGMAVGIVCIEHTPDAVMSEMISCVGGIPAEYVRARHVPPPLFPTLNTALARIYHASICFSQPTATDMKSVHSFAARLKRRHRIKVLMVESIEALAGTPGDRPALLRTSEQLQDICEKLGLCLVATCRTLGIYKSVRRSAVIDADGYGEGLV